MTVNLPTAEEWANRCRDDGEFMLAARHWNGALTLAIDASPLTLDISNGQPGDEPQAPFNTTVLSGPESAWQQILAAVPERFNNDIMANIMQSGGISRESDPVAFAQYYPAMARAIELLRESTDEGSPMAHDLQPEGTICTPVGRYVHMNLGGATHRIYFEEAGEGIPLLLQHTAGCHSSQWRHLFEIPEITSRFRLIAYDLPYHGKSLPPVEKSWWEDTYELKGDFLRSIPTQLSRLLNLDQPVFMGCSVGGLLALDLAHKHPDDFRAVISLEGALEVPGATDHNAELWHPQVSNEYKARMMDALMSPLSPKRYRKETSFVYAAGWPPVFLGDLYYYLDEFDLRNVAAEIDTNRIGVHILSGEYDCSGTRELGEAAHQAIAGSTFTEMKAVGHFPMSENPAEFLSYLLPVLDNISS